MPVVVAARFRGRAAALHFPEDRELEPTEERKGAEALASTCFASCFAHSPTSQDQSTATTTRPAPRLRSFDKLETTPLTPRLLAPLSCLTDGGGSSW